MGGPSHVWGGGDLGTGKLPVRGSMLAILTNLKAKARMETLTVKPDR